MLFSQKEKSVIYEAFDMYYTDYCNTLPSNEELSYITFTKEFEDKMQKLIEREKKFYFYWVNTVGKRVAAIILAVLIGLTTITFSVKALREPIINYIVQTYEKFSHILYASDKYETLDIEFETKTPQYIPEGFVAEDVPLTPPLIQIVYYDTNKVNYIIYSQIFNDASSVHINTENTTYEEIEINCISAVFYSNKGTNTIVIAGDKYLFSVNGTVSKEELIKIVESIDIE